MRLFRISNVLILGLATTLGGALFWTSQHVQARQDALAVITAQARHEREALNVLTAEWDYLNRPQRLEQLAAEYLDVERPSEKSIVTDVSAIPEPAAPVIPPVKPVIMRAVAVRPAPPPAPAAPVIEKNDSERFQTLLNNLSGGGE